MAFSILKNANYPSGITQAGDTDSPPTGILVYDSSNISGASQPGSTVKVKLTDGTQQSATTRTSDSTIAGGGSFYPASAEATYGGIAPGYSILHE